MTLDSRRRFWIFLVGYAVTLLFLLPRLSLWVDEILGLSVAIQPDFASFLEQIKLLEGGTPLTFVPPAWAMALFGKTAFAGRLPSAVASVASCAGVFLLARRLGMRQPLAAVLVFALCPLQFRYAMEARPYALGLCFSIWSTVVFLKLVDRKNSLSGLLVYAALQLLAAYTMLYALFAAAAHLLWLIATAAGRRVDRRVLLWCGASVLLACGSLVPWFLLFRDDWMVVSPPSAPVPWNAPQVILHELTGAGYFGTVLLLGGAWWGSRRRDWPPEGRGFYILYALIPVVLALLADILFSYFFAVRQVIFILAPLALLFALGAESLGKAGKALLLVFLAAALYEDFNWMTKPREDWQAGASAASRAIAEGGCVVFVPDDAFRLYTYFEPGLLSRQCAPNPTGRVVLAISHYGSDTDYDTARRTLIGRGYVKESEASFDGPRVELYRP